MTSHVIDRFGEHDMCAGGCGRVREAQTVYCAECRDVELVKSPYVERDLDIHIELMEERLKGKTRWKDRLGKEGTHPCRFCGRPALPGRIYCSPRCRGASRKIGGVQVVLDGVKDSLVGHARRRGIKDTTYLMRVFRGHDPIEALKKKVRPLGVQVVVVDGIEGSIPEHIRRLKVNEGTVRIRIHRGMDPVEALTKPIQKKKKKK